MVRLTMAVKLILMTKQKLGVQPKLIPEGTILLDKMNMDIVE